LTSPQAHAQGLILSNRADLPQHAEVLSPIFEWGEKQEDYVNRLAVNGIECQSMVIDTGYTDQSLDKAGPAMRHGDAISQGCGTSLFPCQDPVDDPLFVLRIEVI